jgi:hypothetical protein
MKVGAGYKVRSAGFKVRLLNAKISRLTVGGIRWWAKGMTEELKAAWL